MPKFKKSTGYTSPLLKRMKSSPKKLKRSSSPYKSYWATQKVMMDRMKDVWNWALPKDQQKDFTEGIHGLTPRAAAAFDDELKRMG